MALQLCPGGSQWGPGQRVGLRSPTLDTPTPPLPAPEDSPSGRPPQEVLLGRVSRRGEAPDRSPGNATQGRGVLTDGVPTVACMVPIFQRGN